MASTLEQQFQAAASSTDDKYRKLINANTAEDTPACYRNAAAIICNRLHELATHYQQHDIVNRALRSVDNASDPYNYVVENHDGSFANPGYMWQDSGWAIDGTKIWATASLDEPDLDKESAW